MPCCGTDSRPRKRVGPRLTPFGIMLIIADDASGLCRHGKNGNRQL
jgi:hypothetical protein